MRDEGDAVGEGLRYGPLSESLGFLLRLAQLGAFRDFYDDVGGTGVRPGEMSVLLLIAENPGVRQGVLARGLMIKRAHMTKMVRAMETEGLVRRTVPEDDRRSVELWLTEAGAARVEALRGPVMAHEARAPRGLNRRETAQLKRLLRAYVNLPPEPGAPSEEDGS